MNPVFLVNGPPPQWAGTAQVFTALGDPYRQRILLAFEPGDCLSIRQLAEHLPLSRTAVVHHLNVLHEAGLLLRASVGRETQYQLNLQRLQDALIAVQGYLPPLPSAIGAPATATLSSACE